MTVFDLEQSRLFDDQHYSNAVGVRFASRQDAYAHWLKRGVKKRIAPTPFFIEEYYRAKYPDLQSIKGWAFQHFASHGLKEQRTPTPLFHPDFVPAWADDKSGSGKLEIWLGRGIDTSIPPAPCLRQLTNALRIAEPAERRQVLTTIAELFNTCTAALPLATAAAYDVLTGMLLTRASIKKELDEVAEFLQRRLRTFAETSNLLEAGHIFNREYYGRKVAVNFKTDLDAISHWLSHRQAMQVVPTPAFDLGFYLAENADLSLAQDTAYLHYVQRGQFEGRAPHGARPKEQPAPLPDRTNTGSSPPPHAQASTVPQAPVSAEARASQGPSKRRLENLVPAFFKMFSAGESDPGSKTATPSSIGQAGQAASPAPQPARKVEKRDPEYFGFIEKLQIALAKGEVAAAKEHADQLLAKYEDKLEGWGSIALSRFFERTGSNARSLELADNALRSSARNSKLFFYASLRQLELGRIDAVKAARPPENVNDPYRPAAMALVSALNEDIKQLSDILDNNDLPPDTVPHVTNNWVRFGGTALAVDNRVDQRLLGLLTSGGAANQANLNARLALLYSRRSWDEMAGVLDEIDKSGHTPARDVHVKRLELCLAKGRDDDARRIYRQHFVGRKLTKWEGHVVLRLLSHLKEWTEAGERLREHLRSGFGVQGAKHLAMRIVRRGNLYADLIEDFAMEPAPGDAPRESDCLDFYQIVQRERNILEGVTDLMPLGIIDMASADSLAEDSGAGVSPVSSGKCLFMCSDRKYFLSLLTFLLSVLGQSAQSDCDLFVFVDDDVPNAWQNIVRLIGKRFNRHIRVVRERDFVEVGTSHQVEYGFFSAGAVLSRAAYFRLYAARYLHRMGHYQRALYIDTDTVCRSSLDSLFNLDLAGNPLAARFDEASPEVRRACKRNNLDPLKYFNSGVLLLDFDHREIMPAIEEAIRLSEHEPERLTFHDQCALNIAFTNQVLGLEPRYNFFLRPHRVRNGHIEDGIILHYLDRPKPWDLSFDRTYQEEWRVWLLLLSSMVNKTALLELYAAANGET